MFPIHQTKTQHRMKPNGRSLKNLLKILQQLRRLQPGLPLHEPTVLCWQLHPLWLRSLHLHQLHRLHHLHQLLLPESHHHQLQSRFYAIHLLIGRLQVPATSQLHRLPHQQKLMRVHWIRIRNGDECDKAWILENSKLKFFCVFFSNV